MKTLHIFLLLFISLSVSCQSDDDDPPSQNDYFIRAQIEDTNWGATTFLASYINNIVSIEADGPNNSTIEISVQNVTSTGIYSLGNVSIGAYEDGPDNGQTYTTSGGLGTGTINFTLLNASKAEGTFSFTGGNGLGDSKNINNGVFKINLDN